MRCSERPFCPVTEGESLEGESLGELGVQTYFWPPGPHLGGNTITRIHWPLSVMLASSSWSQQLQHFCQAPVCMAEEGGIDKVQ